MVSSIIFEGVAKRYFPRTLSFNNVSYNDILQHAHINLLFCFLLGLVASDIWLSVLYILICIARRLDRGCLLPSGNTVT